jgi:hypothetical protein
MFLEQDLPFVCAVGRRVRIDRHTLFSQTNILTDKYTTIIETYFLLIVWVIMEWQILLGTCRSTYPKYLLPHLDRNRGGELHLFTVVVAPSVRTGRLGIPIPSTVYRTVLGRKKQYRTARHTGRWCTVCIKPVSTGSR